jgi:hypothetical protein
MPEDKIPNNDHSQETWRKYCGFFDLSLAEFMEIQEHMLLEEIELVSPSPLGKILMKGARPKSVEEFRQAVPLTTYDDYIPHIGNCQEEGLAEKPYCWVRTSGRGGLAKWIPLTQRAYKRIGMYGVMVFIMACAAKKGEVRIDRKTRFMQNLPPKPFYTGAAATATLDELPLQMLPSLEQSEKMSFEDRIATGFKLALRGGVDVLGSLTTVLIKMGERLTDSSQGMKFSANMLHPMVMYRLIRAMLKAKAEKRKILPKDLWPLKGLICYGIDTKIYKEELKYYWGKEPLEVYGGTETGIVAIQSWRRQGMTFIPFFTFFEFIPEDEWVKNRENKDYQPSTVLLNQVEKGKRYELVISSFYGMPLLRYRVGDLIKITDLEDKEAGIQIPQMEFDTRADGLIDIGGFIRLDEKTVWKAIANSGIKHEDWTIRKEYDKDEPVLRLYIELKEDLDSDNVEERIHKELVTAYTDYRDLEEMLEIKPLRVVILARGSFQEYYQEKRRAGADLSHLKPPHMNVSDEALEDLMRLTVTRQ